jgi:hypothetical protein
MLTSLSNALTRIDAAKKPMDPITIERARGFCSMESPE